jgi:hypothetical protein
MRGPEQTRLSGHVQMILYILSTIEGYLALDV